jgi:uncharacterized protein (DUF362 family)
MRRRNFLKSSIVAGAGTFILGNASSLFPRTESTSDAVWVSGAEPPALLNKALENIGGIQKFISNGDIVVVKPNIGWDRAPEFAANTNPQLVAEVIRKCFEAGAKEVKVFDRSTNNPQRCYKNSQIESISKQAGAKVEHVRDFKFKAIALPEGDILKRWPIYKDYLEADKTINIPIVKHHSLCNMTAGLKNLMGIMGGNRGEIHNHFSKKLIDIDAHILPSLTIIDGYRVLVRNGPIGGNLSDVKLAKTLIISSCTVTADILALELLGLKLPQVTYLKDAVDRGLIKYDPEKVVVKKISLS